MSVASAASTAKHPSEKATFPMRINRYLAQKGYVTRRQADHLIEKGLVTINGRIAKVGEQVQETDAVAVDRKTMQRRRESEIYLAYNKPIGVVAHSPEKGQVGIEQLVGFKTRLFPIGRLDQDSHGLIILTNDGRITKKLLDPAYAHEKEYIVRVDKSVTDEDLEHLAAGVALEDVTTSPCQVLQTGERTFRMTLTEGKNRQIRRMCEALGYIVEDLCRVRVLNVRLGTTPEGKWRRLGGKELDTFLKHVL